MCACSQISAETIIVNITREPAWRICTDKLNTDTTGTFIGECSESPSKNLLIVMGTSPRNFMLRDYTHLYLKGPKHENFGSRFITPSKLSELATSELKEKMSLTLVFYVFSVKITLKVGTNEDKSGC
jgi:hypothetical protein